MIYEAKITKLVNVRPHPNADRLQLATVSGYQIVVGLENYEGQLGIFFPCDGQLSQEYAESNDLIERKDPVTGERAGGYFSANRRVRSQRLRKEKSDGFWATLDTLAFTKVDPSSLTEGMVFDTLNGVPICNKYYTPAPPAMKRFIRIRVFGRRFLWSTSLSGNLERIQPAPFRCI